MKRVFAALLLLLIAGGAEASVFFKIVDAPTIFVSPEGEAGFTISVQNLGSQSTYAGLIFRNIPEGLSIVGPRCTKWVDSGTRREFDCQLLVEAAAVPPGSYTFEVGIAAAGAPPEWTPVEVIVADDPAPGADRAEDAVSKEPYEDLMEQEEYPACPVVRDLGGAEGDGTSEGEEMPGFGICAALGAAAVLIFRRGRRIGGG
jgi:hypothetical protein